jgi:hypothetical protein
MTMEADGEEEGRGPPLNITPFSSIKIRHRS